MDIYFSNTVFGGFVSEAEGGFQFIRSGISMTSQKLHPFFRMPTTLLPVPF